MIHNSLYAFYFITTLLLFLVKGKKTFNSSTTIAILMSLWLAFSRFLVEINDSLRIAALFGAPMVLIGVYFIASSVNFYEFRELLLKHLNRISIITILTWFIHETFFPYSFTYGSTIFFLVFHKWGDRMASLWWEPGMYQIIMIFILMLFMDELKKISFSNLRYYIKKFGWVIACLIMCRSTMGYMCLIAMIGLVFLFNDSLGKKKFLYFLGLVLGVVLIILILRSDVVVQKIGEDENTRSGSYRIRMQDNIALLNMSFVSPILGIGENSRLTEKYGVIYNNITASNGWLKLAVRSGWPFLICFILIMLKGLSRMKLGVPAVMAFIPLFLSYSNEHYILYPIALIYLFKYKSYKKVGG